MPFHVLVQVWCEPDPTLNVRVDRATGQPIAEEGDQLLRVSPMGRAAVRQALRLGDVEVTAFALGDGHQAALRHALAAGAGRAVELCMPGIGPTDELTAAGMLTDWLRRESPALVIADRAAGRVAHRLGWSHLAGLDELRIEGDRLQAIRHLGRGDRERVSALLPAAVRLAAEAVRVDYIAQARIAAVSEADIERLDAPAKFSTAAVQAGPWQPARLRTRLGASTSTAAAPARGLDRLAALVGQGQSRGTRVQGPGPEGDAPEAPPATIDEMAAQFVRYLAHHDLLP